MFAERRDNYQQDEDAFGRSGQQALCQDGTGELTALFFSEQLDDIAQAKAICEGCPLREPCFTEARARREPFGVWGGRLFFKGKVLAVKRARGRPPKLSVVGEETLIA